MAQDLHQRARPRPALVVALTLAVLLGVGGCSASTAGSAPTESTSASAGPTEGAPCVTDVAKVIATQPTPQMTTETLPASLVTALDAAAQESLSQISSPGVVVGVRTPAGTWTKAYGQADPDAGTPMAVGVHTRIGSITKTFTGTALLVLAEQGKLSLDDTIDNYVPDVPNGDRISLRQLADMTSGVASYTLSTKFTDTYFAKPQTVFTPPELLAVGLAESPLFEPGARFDYSNTNTVLLGMVIEKVTGRPVGEELKSLVFDPLHLSETSWPGTSTELPEPYAQGFTLQGDTAEPDAPSNSTHWNPAWGWTAGELISTIGDLLTYGRALGTGQGVLNAASQTERLTSFPSPIGYGIAVGCIDGWVGHTGELPGYNTSLFYDTTSDTTVAVQTNSDIASGSCDSSPTLADDPRDLPCSAPATRVFVALSNALGHTFTPNPQH
jgi:D-alanyl-D-alanine carboxypeptidase